MVNLGFSIPLFFLGLFTCYWTTYAWHSPEKHIATQFVHTRDTSVHSFSVIVPVRNEPYGVLNATISCLLAQTHRMVQAVISVGFDDPETIAVAERIKFENPYANLLICISHSTVHNKPTQLNAALAECTGDIVGILDAESLASPDLIAQVDAAFQDSTVSVVQGGVIMTNHRSSWVALRSCLEYYSHHRSKMHYSAAHSAILMGGNTVFFYRDLLNALGGWDETNLAEDAELSLRLLTSGHDVTVAYDPHLVSREEAPTTLRAWTKQRTRWNLGFLQTIKKGVWKDLPTRRQRQLAMWHLLQPTIMSITGLVLPLSIFTLLFTHPPLVIAMLTWAPAAPTVFIVAIEATMLRTYGTEHGFKVRTIDYIKLILSTPLYQVMLAFASLRAVVKYLQNDMRWDKTTHIGLHHTTQESTS